MGKITSGKQWPRKKKETFKKLKMWHGLKKGAKHFVAFSAPVEIISICSGVQKCYEKTTLDGRGECVIAHG